MSEDPTKDLTDSEKLDRILAELADVKTRLGALEAQSAGATRPLLDQIIREVTETRDTLAERIDRLEKEMAEVRKDVRQMDRTFATFAIDHTRMRADIRDFDERLTEIERRPM